MNVADPDKTPDGRLTALLDYKTPNRAEIRKEYDSLGLSVYIHFNTYSELSVEVRNEIVGWMTDPSSSKTRVVIQNHLLNTYGIVPRNLSEDMQEAEDMQEEGGGGKRKRKTKKRRKSRKNRRKTKKRRKSKRKRRKGKKSVKSR